MKNLAFIISIAGLSLLLALMLFLPQKHINSLQETKNLTDNSKVSLSGKVIKESSFGSSTLLTLDSNIEILCSCKTSYKNKNISINGVVDSFSGKKRIKALKIEILS